ncbi:nitroreductase family protein [Longibacter sp.]|uniref:nitroreductase family protein n=1 Tax=Longibacter sp. TaxID=2045415 RepID=UPI003EBBDB56
MDLSAAKRADTMTGVLDEIQKRWSPRAFADRSVPAEDMRRLLDAARWAMSSYNEQPWRYVVATREDEDGYDRVLGCLNEFNRSWAKTAPVLMLGFVQTSFSRNGKPNRHARHDLGAASAFLTLQAARLDLYVHQMAGILPDVIRDTFDLPEDAEPVTGLAVGYLGDPEDLPEKLARREREERERQPLSDFVFDADAYGTPSPVVTD